MLTGSLFCAGYKSNLKQCSRGTLKERLAFVVCFTFVLCVDVS